MIKKIILIAASVLLVGVSSSAFEWEWKRIPADSHITGVKSPTADDVVESLGVVTGGTYYAPSSRVFCGGTVRKVASLMIAAQPAMAPVKEVIGYCETPFVRNSKGENSLFDMISDCVREGLRDSLGVNTDVFLYNKGGVRTDLMRGNIILDDVVSMLPFNNKIVVVKLKGSDLYSIFEQISRDHVLFYSGAKMKVKGDKLVSLEIGGKKINFSSLYSVGTIDFTLEGGDGYSIGRCSQETNFYDYRPIDFFLPYVKSFALKGLPVTYPLDDRYVVEN